MILLSFIVTVFNTEPYIEQCLESICLQVDQHQEVILIDDGSEDKSYEICKRFEEKYKGIIKLIHTANKGVSHARNIGIQEAKGKWIFFVDSDDWIEKDFFRNQYACLWNSSEDILLFDYFNEEINRSCPKQFLNLPDGLIEGVNREELVMSCLVKTDISDERSTVNIGVPWAKVYNRKFLLDKNIKFVYGLKRMQDAVFNLYAFRQAKQIRYIRKAVYHYRRNSTASTYGYNRFNFTIAEQLEKEIRNYINQFEEWESRWKTIYYQKVFMNFVEAVRLQYAHRESAVTRSVVVKILKDKRQQEPYVSIVRHVNDKGFNIKYRIAYKLFERNCMAVLYDYVRLGVLYKMSKNYSGYRRGNNLGI